MRFALELFPTAEGRVEGSLAWAEAEGCMPFSGWLELLRLLEAKVLLAGRADATPPEAEPRL